MPAEIIDKKTTSWIYRMNKDELINPQMEALTSLGRESRIMLKKFQIKMYLLTIIRKFRNHGASGNPTTPNPADNEPLAKPVFNPNLSINRDFLRETIHQVIHQTIAGQNENNRTPPPEVRGVANRPDRQAQSDADIIEIVRKWNVHFDGGNDAFEFIDV